MISIIGIFHKQHIKKWFPEIWKPLFYFYDTIEIGGGDYGWVVSKKNDNFLLSRSLSVQASPTPCLLLFAIEAVDFPGSVKVPSWLHRRFLHHCQVSRSR